MSAGAKFRNRDAPSVREFVRQSPVSRGPPHSNGQAWLRGDCHTCGFRAQDILCDLAQRKHKRTGLCFEVEVWLTAAVRKLVVRVGLSEVEDTGDLENQGRRQARVGNRIGHVSPLISVRRVVPL